MLFFTKFIKPLHKNKNMDEKKEHHHESPKKIKINFWMVAAITLAVLLLVVLVFNSMNKVSADKAGKILSDFATAQGVTLTIKNVTSQGSLYAVTAEIQGQTGTFYITKDGKYFTSSVIPLETTKTQTKNTNTQQQEVPKSDRPKVELYVWGYCPYGVQAQGPMAQVAQLLKTNADFEIVPYYDGHGAFETQENKAELCIQKLYPDKYWSYAAKFVSDVYPKCSSTRTVECDKTESTKIMSSLGIDSTKVYSCISTQGDSLFSAASQKAQASGVQGSPTIIINGVTVNVARDAESIKKQVCAAFNSIPSACSTTLNSSAAAASGSCG
jgi:hypothetical protein